MLRTSLFTLLFIVSALNLVDASTWERAKKEKQAVVNVHWFTSNPFIYRDSNGELAGIEYDIITSFQEFLLEKYDISLEVNWIQARSFSDIMHVVGRSSSTNSLGASAFSTTEERLKVLKFTSSYLPDIMVLVSSKGSPIVKSYEEFNALMTGMEAITIQGTSYERQLFELKDRVGVQFDMKYIGSDENILDYISKKPNRFGFIDLPIYLMRIKQGYDLTRQNFFTVRGEGYAFILPRKSRWDEPFSAFFSDQAYQEVIAGHISKYIGSELYDFIEDLYDEQEHLGTSILTKEKEIQLALIKNTNLRLEKEQSFKNILISGIAITSILLVMVGGLLYKNQKNTSLLIQQKDRIEKQQVDIRRKNDQLMDRNGKLVALNEEKNNLVKILAHDLRSPLSQIISFSQLLSKDKIQDEEERVEILEGIDSGAHRISQLVTKILDKDALSNNHIPIFKESVNVRDLVNQVVKRYQNNARTKKIDITIGVFPQKVIVNTDRLLLLQVIENLISNAVKFSPPKSEIVIDSDVDESSVTLEIRDQGPGFTEEDQKLVFNRFQKLSAKPTGGEISTGLGLSIVKKYISELGGEVWLKSDKESGSSFFIRIPLQV